MGFHGQISRYSGVCRERYWRWKSQAGVLRAQDRRDRGKKKEGPDTEVLEGTSGVLNLGLWRLNPPGEADLQGRKFGLVPQANDKLVKPEKHYRKLGTSKETEKF